MSDLSYRPPGPLIKAFMKDDSFVRGIRGPVGSGKSTACSVEIMRRASLQLPDPDGIARFRAVAIRNTNPELRTTTIKTWLDVFPEHKWGRFNWSAPYTHRIRTRLAEDLARGLPDRELDLEVLFLPLDQPRDVARLLSLETTMIWVNEARELEKPIIDGCTMRVGRYPSMRHGGATWAGVIMDTNPPDAEHWWPIMAGEVPIPEWVPEHEQLMLKPQGNWKFWNQPAAMRETFDHRGQVAGYTLSSEGENVTNLRPGYYENMIQGKTRSWIDVYVMNRLGAVEDGKPVYERFRKETHVAEHSFSPTETGNITIGLDFGLTPAAVFAQRTGRGQWTVFHEITSRDMGAVRFAEVLRADISRLCPWLGKGNQHRLQIFGDPAGDERQQTDETTVYDILRGAGLIAFPTDSNDFGLRVEAVDATLGRMIDGSLPGILISPDCKVLIAGMAGRYHYRRLQIMGDARYETIPAKNRWSHVCEALQYLLLGAGEGRQLTRGPKPMRPVVAKVGFNVWDRRKQLARRDRPTV